MQKIKSTYYCNSVINRWARINKTKMGQEGYAGWCMYVENEGQFTIEHRGPNFPSCKFVFTFSADTWLYKNKQLRWHSVYGRNAAFEKAINVFLRLSLQKCKMDIKKSKKLK